MYRIVASDMDETFLAHDHTIPQANVDAIRRLRAMGCLFVPASGRPYGSVMESLAALPPELMDGSYVISYNGACINRAGEDEPLFSTTMAHQTAQRLFDYGRGLGLCVHVYELSGRIWIFGMPAEERGYLEGHVTFEESDERSLDFLAGTPLVKVLYCLPNGDARLHQVLAEMPEEVLAGVSPTFSSGRYLELNCAGVDKAAGLDRLAELLGCSLDETIACGDAPNDLGMVAAAGMGVAVSNASGELKAAAGYVTASSNEDGFLAEVAERIVAPANQA